MQVKNKTESDFMIKKLGLNRMLEGIFSNNQREELANFLNKHQFPYYNMRDKSKSMGEFLYKLTFEEVVKNSVKYDKFSVYESLADADTNHMILQGDIHIDYGWNMMASLDTHRCISNRIAMQQPQYKILLNLIEDKTPYIQGLNQVLNYIITHELFNVYVEFTYFDIPLGINKENLLIWELRNY